MHDGALRKTILEQRDKLSVEAQEEKSRRIQKSLLALPEIAGAEVLFIYVHFRSEVRTLSLIEHCLATGKRVLVPVTLVAEKRLAAVEIRDPVRELEPGYCAIPEPLGLFLDRGEDNPSTIDLVVLPGSVFDTRGGRFGYGGGYYDRFLVNQAGRATRIAVAYDLQVVDRLDLQPHDQLMDRIVTEKNIYTCNRG